jgi:NhaP-type Na+/H+ or K+/H+ antiporter
MIELAGIIILGILAQWFAWKIKVPAILPLIIVGLLVGPLSTLWTPNGMKLIQPIYNEETHTGLFPGESLFYFVSLAIGIILFEGGLTLKRKEVAGVGKVILRLITVGTTISFIGSGLAAHYLMGLSWQISMLFGALVVVTGPTVIAPILQNIPLTRNVATVLKWEGILIDPIGALMAVLVFEFIRSSAGSVALTSQAFISFFQILFIGLAVGGVAAFLMYQLLKNNLIPHYLLNVFTLAFVLAIFVFSDIMAHESGLLSVVVMGMVLGNMEVPRIKEILSFKESLSVLLISILFILLAANMDLADLQLLLDDWRALVLFCIVAFLLRPVGVLVSTLNSGLRFNEKIFISWVGSRGIVAAGIASLFGITLVRNGVEGAEYITPLVFMIVLGTVLINATTARLLARLLNVIQVRSDGILFIGASRAARVLAKYLHDNDRHVVLIDNNEANVRRAKQMGLESVAANIYTEDLEEQFELVDMGYMIAMTSSPEVNNYAVRRYRKVFGEMGTYRLITPEELRKAPEELKDEEIFSFQDDFLNINEAARDYPTVHEMPVRDREHLQTMVEKLNRLARSIPVFIREPSGNLQILPAKLDDFSMEEEGDYALVYMGKEVEEEPVEEEPKLNP